MFNLQFHKRKLEHLKAAINCSHYTSGKTHQFYLYPARFAPEFATTVIREFSRPNEWVLDPFMGGGTSIVEGIALGRRMIGIDLNALAYFVASTRTTPLSESDAKLLIEWGERVALLLSLKNTEWIDSSSIRNLSPSVRTFLAGALNMLDELTAPRQRAFARCALLRLGQWALDCRDFVAPGRRRLSHKFRDIIGSMLRGLDEFVECCRKSKISKHKITSRRILLNRDTTGVETDELLKYHKMKIALIVTSPPYPGVHVLYHRWQYRGRSETPAPYWVANVADGCGESYYTFGSRRTFWSRGVESGMEQYGEKLTAAFKSISHLLAPHALVFQLVAFPNPEKQLPVYLNAMSSAGFEEANPWGERRQNRHVPNRKWYARNRGHTGASSELLLIHRIKT